MLRVGSWLYGKKPAAQTQSMDSLTELRDLEDALQGMSTVRVSNESCLVDAKPNTPRIAAALIMNDDVDGAEDGLSEGTSSFHNLGKGVVTFMRATLGFEQDIMRQASERLAEAENSAYSDEQRARNNPHAPNAFHSQIYAPGTEFALCQTMAQLMSAVVGVLNESLTESVKGFYKLRKAFLTLDAILQMEENFIRAKRSGAATSTPSSRKSNESSRHLASNKNHIDPGLGGGHVPADAKLSHKLTDLDISKELGDANSSTGNMLNVNPDSDLFKNPIDVFIHSGANFCFGILLLLISMVPPAFSKLLSIIGFHGDKQRGLRMLWQASKFHNLIGAISAFAVLGYYNGFVRYCDIMPDATPEDADVEGYPQARLESLLADMRKRFPKSQLWMLEESRMEGANKNLERALERLCGKSSSPLKQVEALRVFERSLNAMYLHKYELCAESFLECYNLNSWSRSLYYYIVGSCHLTLYRQKQDTDAKQAALHAEKATEYFRGAPPLAGKKRFMARQLPFDVFVSRKIAKWESRAKERKVPLVDAVGIDPVEEMIFFWNGHSRMTPEQLETSLSNLSWSEGPANKASWAREGLEEKAILNLLRAAALRSLRRHSEARALLHDHILVHDKSNFKGYLKDDWICPVAHFEMAANLWMERPAYIADTGPPPVQDQSQSQSQDKDQDPNSTDKDLEREKALECKEFLEKAARWESYELDARIGLKVTAAIEAVEKWERAHSSSSSSSS